VGGQFDYIYIHIICMYVYILSVRHFRRDRCVAGRDLRARRSRLVGPDRVDPDLQSYIAGLPPPAAAAGGKPAKPAAAPKPGKPGAAAAPIPIFSPAGRAAPRRRGPGRRIAVVGGCSPAGGGGGGIGGGGGSVAGSVAVRRVLVLDLDGPDPAGPVSGPGAGAGSRWVGLPELPRAVKFGAAAACGGHLVVAGGQAAGGGLGSVGAV
jgi:hypothetical protein